LIKDALVAQALVQQERGRRVFGTGWEPWVVLKSDHGVTNLTVGPLISSELDSTDSTVSPEGGKSKRER
jgi:hypothetical protein